jgi:DNA-binding beta-propeller fold protein YncE
MPGICSGARRHVSGASARSRAFIVVAALIFLVAAIFSLSAQASKVKIASFGSVGGASGQFSAANSPRGIAVNNASGNVYVADFSNHRINVFTASGTPIRSWGNKVVASGQHFATSANAVQTLTVTATGGKYKLKFSGSETGELPFSATNGEIQTALRSLASVGPVGNTNVNVTGTGPFTITFANTLINSPEPAITVESGPTEPLTGGTVTISVVNPGATGFTSCDASSAPQDVCQAGSSSALAGGMFGPTGVAIDQSTGNVYVTEQNNRRVSEYTASGVWIATWGLDVVKFGQDNLGTGVFEICKAASNPVDICQIGAAGGVGGAFESAFQSGIAVAPTAHTVYVADQANNRIQEFSSAGEFIQAFGFDVAASGPGNTGTGFEVCKKTAGDVCQKGVGGNAIGQFGAATGASRIAVDTAGNVYVADFLNQRVQKFVPAGSTFTASLFGPSGPTAVPFGVAVDPATNNVLIGRQKEGGTSELQVAEYSPAGTLLDTHGVGSKVGEGVAGAVSSTSGNIAYNLVSGSIYLDFISATPKVSILNFAPAPTVHLTEIVNGATSATFKGTVTPPAENEGVKYETSWHFEYSTDGTHWTNVPVADQSAGSINVVVPVEASASGLLPNTLYQVRLCATTGTVSCDPVPPKSKEFTTLKIAPSVVTAFAEEISQDEAILAAKVNPNNLASTYHFEWATASEWSEAPNSYSHRVPAFERQLGAGGSTVFAQDTLAGLSPQSTYHFRIVARNFCHPKESGDPVSSSVPCETASSDRQFETLGANGLPDDRAAELVSPADKRPSGLVGSISGDNAIEAQASGDGGTMIYPLLNGLDGSTGGGNLLEVATRTSSGWQSIQLSPPSLGSPREPINGEAVNPSGVLTASPAASCGVVKSFSSLTADTPALDGELGLPNLYVWRSGGQYELVTTRVPLNPGIVIRPGGGDFRRVAASSDCSQVFFKSDYQYLTGSTGLYEWRDGDLHDAGMLPNGSMAAGEVFEGTAPDNPALPNTAGAASTWGVVAPDGSLFLSAISNEGLDIGKRAIFLRSDDGATVVDISQSQNPSVSPNGVRFEAATPDGSHVFFRGNHGLAGTPGGGSSSNGPTNGECGKTDGSLEFLDSQACDLYRYDVANDTLTDLSVDLNSADLATGPSVQGVVAVSPDGSHVYFAARGQVVPGKGKTYAENLQSSSGGKFGSVNIYLAHGGIVKYITTLSQQSESSGDLLRVFAGSVLMRSYGWTAATNEGGDRLLFTSTSSTITGYNSGGPPEAYLYSEGQSEPDSIVCVSCRRDGLSSAFPSGKTLQSPVPVSGRQLRNVTRARAMSANGRRVFFTSYNRLAPEALEGQKNIYEWEDGNVYFLAVANLSGGSGAGSYLDSSASGNDVFIATSDRLSPQDEDSVSDVYDLRVDGGFLVPSDPSDCQLDEAIPLILGQSYCQGEAPIPPPMPVPGTLIHVGPGNESPPKPCRKGTVRKHGKCVSKNRGQGKSKKTRKHKARTRSSK